jgi:pyruvate/2-oxoglutarate dehydrogenase complex dihydrolipoamide acyltransferase (E2) component
MAEEQPTFKVVDRRPFNPDGTPRELSAEEKEEAERAEKAAAVQEAAVKAASEEAAATPPKRSASTAATEAPQAKPKAAAPPAEPAPARAGGDPLDDPTSFLSLIMSLASNAASSLGMMPHPMTGETGVDLKTAKHWIDVLGMLEKKTEGNLDDQEAQVIEGLLADLRMQFVSFSGSPTPPPAKFSASDITGGK